MRGDKGRILAVVTVLVGLAAASLMWPDSADSMKVDGCGAGECKDCHELSLQEAQELLKGAVDEVNAIKFSEVGGLWEVEVTSGGSRVPVFVDFSKKYLISGQVIKLATKENLTQKRVLELNRVDVASIPLEDAVVVGNPKASKRIVVFDDPECPFCIKLHEEMKKAVKSDKDVAFFIKLFPLKIHPKAYDKARAIVCEKSLKLLEDSFAGKELPPPTCKGDVVDRNIELAQKLGIKSTPTLIFPSGLVVPGYKKADEILKILGSAGSRPKTEK